MSNEVNNFAQLSNKELIILAMLANKTKMYGLEMVENSHGQLKRGTIYVTLMRMAEKGYVESYEEQRQSPEIGIPRRIYNATPLGITTYNTNLSRRKIFLQLVWGGVQ